MDSVGGAPAGGLPSSGACARSSIADSLTGSKDRLAQCYRPALTGRPNLRTEHDGRDGRGCHTAACSISGHCPGGSTNNPVSAVVDGSAPPAAREIYPRLLPMQIYRP